MCGGAGSRLWPASRPDRPKPLLALAGERTLLDDTVARFAAPGFAPAWLIAGAVHEAPMAAALPGVRRLVEPTARGTVAAVGAAAALAADEDGPDALVLMAPADHAVADPAALRAAIASGASAAAEGWIAAFGIVPTHAATGFGWIRAGAALGGSGARRIDAFVEKPSKDVAARLLAAGGHTWNSGMFLFAAGAVARELERLAPELWATVVDAVDRAVRGPDRVVLDPDAFARAPAGSFDRVVMERTDRAAVVPVDCGWSDVGTWGAVRELRRGASAGPVALTESPGAFAWSDGPKVEVRGCPGVTVVASADGVLVAGPDRPDRPVPRIAAVCDAGPAWIPGAPLDAQPGWAAHDAHRRHLAERWRLDVGALPDGGVVWLIDVGSDADVAGAVGLALAEDPWRAAGVLAPARVVRVP